MTYKKTFKSRITTERGASMVEYALLLAMITLVAVGALKGVRAPLSSTFNQAGNMVACGGTSGGDDCRTAPQQHGL